LRRTGRVLRDASGSQGLPDSDIHYLLFTLVNKNLLVESFM